MGPSNTASISAPFGCRAPPVSRQSEHLPRRLGQNPNIPVSCVAQAIGKTIASRRQPQVTVVSDREPRPSLVSLAIDPRGSRADLTAHIGENAVVRHGIHRRAPGFDEYVLENRSRLTSDRERREVEGDGKDRPILTRNEEVS